MCIAAHITDFQVMEFFFLWKLYNMTTKFTNTNHELTLTGFGGKYYRFLKWKTIK
jgi:hypothetical protein